MENVLIFQPIDMFLLSSMIIISPEQVLTYFQVMSKVGTLVHTIGILTAMVTIVVGTVSVQFFIGEYTRYSYIKFWDILPAFKGVGYVTVFVSLMDISWQSSRLYVGFKFFFEMIVQNWLSCDILKTNKTCVSLETKANIKECNDGPLKLSSIAYYEEFYPYDQGKYAELSIELFLGVLCTWGVIFIFVAVGMKKMIKVYRYTILGCYVFQFPFLIISLVMTSYSSYRRPNIYLMPRLTLELLVEYFNDLCFTTSYHERPFLLLYLASRSKMSFDPYSVSLMLYSFKFLLLLLLTSCIFNLISVTQRGMNVSDGRCFNYKGVEIFFGFIPAGWYFLGFPKPLVSLYCLFFLLWQIPVVVVSVEAAMLSLCQVHALCPKKFKFFLPLSLCSLCFLLALVSISFNHADWAKLYRNTLRPQFTSLSMVLFTLAVTLYSFESLCTDYQFQYGSKKKMQWVFNVKIALVMHVISFCINTFYLNLHKLSSIHAMALLMCMYGPLIFVFVLQLRKMKNFRMLFEPKENFGPYGEQEKKDREAYIMSKYEKRLFKDTKKLCKHTCITNSVQFQREVDFTEYKLEYFRKVFNSYVRNSKDDDARSHSTI